MYFGFKIICLVYFMGVFISSVRGAFDLSEVPFVVTIKLKGGYYFTGSLSAMNKVMTSAVIFLELESDKTASKDILKDTTVYAGLLNLSTNSSSLIQNRTVVDVKISPNYVFVKGKISQSDISIAFLNRPFTSSDTVSVFPIEDSKTFQDSWNNMGKDDCFAVGAGFLNKGDGGSLRKINLALLHDCFNMTHEVLRLNSLGCAQPSSTANDTFCSGDDGGPVVCQGKVFGLIAKLHGCITGAILFHVLSNDLSFVSGSASPTYSVKILLFISTTLISIVKLTK